MLLYRSAGEESSLAVIEPNREDAKAELQAAMDRTAEACCSADSSGPDLLHADILLRVRPSSTSALVDAAASKALRT